MDALITGSENATAGDGAEGLPDEREELSTCRVDEVDLCEVPDLEEPDACETLPQDVLFQRVAAAAPTDTIDSELEGLD